MENSLIHVLFFHFIYMKMNNSFLHFSLAHFYFVKGDSGLVLLGPQFGLLLVLPNNALMSVLTLGTKVRKWLFGFAVHYNTFFQTNLFLRKRNDGTKGIRLSFHQNYCHSKLLNFLMVQRYPPIFQNCLSPYETFSFLKELPTKAKSFTINDLV